jgi:hypothetical protein
MIGDNGDKDDKDETVLDTAEDEILDDDSSSEDEMPDIGGDTVIDVSVELEAIVEKVGEEDPEEAAHKRAVRKRLDEIEEQRDKDLDSTFNINLDDDI